MTGGDVSQAHFVHASAVQRRGLIRKISENICVSGLWVCRALELIINLLLIYLRCGVLHIQVDYFVLISLYSCHYWFDPFSTLVLDSCRAAFSLGLKWIKYGSIYYESNLFFYCFPKSIS